MKNFVLTNLFAIGLLFGNIEAACDIPTSLRISNLTENSVTLQWNKSDGAIRYEVEIEDGDNTPAFNKEFKTSQTSASIDGLTPGGQYKFKVKSECSSGSSDHAPWFFFVAGDGNGDQGDGSTSSCAVPDGLAIGDNLGTSVILSWNTAQGAIRYEVEIEDDDNTPAFNKEFKTAQTSASIDGLTHGGQYKFKVKSECSSGSSDHAPWFFFIAGDGNGDQGGGNTSSCAVPGGLAISDNLGTSVVLSWNTAEGAIRYEVEIEDGDNTPAFNKEFKTSQTSASIDGLTHGGQYKFKVKSECSSGSSDHAPWFFFVAGDGNGDQGSGSTGSCAVPDGLAISDNLGTSVVLSWNTAEGAIRYEVEIEDGDNTPAFNKEFKTSQTSASIDGLTPGGQYKFKVKSECSSGSSDHAPWFFFVAGEGDGSDDQGGGGTTSCVIPDGLAISDNLGTSVVLSWNTAEGAIRYEVEIEDGDNTPAFNKEFKTSQTSASIDGLTPGGQYKFKVKSECSSGSSDHAPWFFFVAGNGNGDQGDGSTSSCAVPDGLAISDNLCTSVVISWKPAEGALQYEVEIEDVDNTAAFNKEFKTSQTSAYIDGLIPGGQYKFKVKSECSSGSSDHAPWFHFTTHALDNNNAFVTINAFPNPVSNQLRVSLKDARFEGAIRGELIDLSGRIVWVQEFEDATGLKEFQIPVSSFREGFYLLNLHTMQRIERVRIFVQH